MESNTSKFKVGEMLVYYVGDKRLPMCCAKRSVRKGKTYISVQTVMPQPRNVLVYTDELGEYVNDSEDNKIRPCHLWAEAVKRGIESETFRDKTGYGEQTHQTRC